MNKYIREQIWNECNKANHFIEIPGIYRHFKQIKDGEDMIYAVSAVSLPLNNCDLNEMLRGAETYDFNHTELEREISIARYDDKYCHNSEEEPEILVIYTALYGDRKTYVRPLPMFISKTDKVKYPNAAQKFRLEQIK